MSVLPRNPAALLLAVVTSACGGGSDGGSTPTSPSPGGGSGGAGLTIAIVATSGAQSFTPNPAAQAQGSSTVAWRNSDGVVHRIVANDGTFDTGNISPGATSQAVTAPAGGINYHCSLHPNMVGAIGTAQGEAPPPCSGPYC